MRLLPELGSQHILYRGMVSIENAWCDIGGKTVEESIPRPGSAACPGYA